MKNANATSPARTPGPWTAREITTNHVYILAEDSAVASLYLGSSNWANAHLLAAAPDLFDDLQCLVQTARAVAVNWERGDLAAAVQNLERIARAAEGTLARAVGAPE